MENLSRQTRITDASITSRIEEMEDKILGVEHMVEEVDLLVKENVKSSKFLTQNLEEIWDTLKMKGIE